MSKVSSKIQKQDFDNLMKTISKWQKIRLITISGDLVLEIDGQFPMGSYGRGYYNFHSKTSPIGGHLKQDAVAYIQMGTKTIHGKESFFFSFYNENNDVIFKIFLGRNEQGQIFEDQLNDFNSLFEKYGEQKLESQNS